jgi:hypothetical protein
MWGNDACWCNHDRSVRSWRILKVTKWRQVMDHAGGAGRCFRNFRERGNSGLDAAPASMRVWMRALVSSSTPQQCPYPGHVHPGISEHNPFDILLGA